MIKRCQLLCGSMLLLFSGQMAWAWSEIEHRVIAQIAWENLTPIARARAVAMLHAAPPDAGLDLQLTADTTSRAVQERALFLQASDWPDRMRDRGFPERRAKYHHPEWHYVNFYWEQAAPGEAPRERTDLAPDTAGSVLEGLEKARQTLRGREAPLPEQALALAWFMHLVGDLHQPLHSSSRVTASEPEGDRGGNLFQLDNKHNLHGYWDNLLEISYPRQEGESDLGFISRLARDLSAAHPREEYAARLQPAVFMAWVRETFALATTAVYTPLLQRGAAPSPAYHQAALEVARSVIALAAYRLAAELNRLLSDCG